MPRDLVERARVLDTFYIPTRYPNAHPSGAPSDHYGPLQSGDALEHAEEILGFVRARIVARRRVIPPEPSGRGQTSRVRIFRRATVAAARSRAPSDDRRPMNRS